MKTTHCYIEFFPLPFPSSEQIRSLPDYRSSLPIHLSMTARRVLRLLHPAAPCRQEGLSLLPGQPQGRAHLFRHGELQCMHVQHDFFFFCNLICSALLRRTPCWRRAPPTSAAPATLLATTPPSCKSASPAISLSFSPPSYS
jgi:hypothetical protein